ncbi:MAG: hypothetical protein M1837_003725 [Sclerophora amabilis]|nr:MAG: hypothetical protein M1837_003725 [Sclerophora amabilis]
MPLPRSGQANGVTSRQTSSHVSDPNLQPFLEATFDPTDFLNASLPQLSLSSSQSKVSRTSANPALPLSELSSSTQSLLSNLNAQTSRLSTTLTQFTDEILRSGSRLAYEVEVLRGETLGLSETLTEELRTDVGLFIPDGLHVEPERNHPAADHVDTDLHSHQSSTRKNDDGSGSEIDETQEKSSTVLPPYLTQLRTLSLVRDRLDTVIKVFGDALEWTIPPSEISITSSFISVSAPEPGSESHSREEKGHQIAKKLRDEVVNLLTSAEDEINGLEAATERVAKLRELASVWKGTAEEKARLKSVESLVKLLEEKQKTLEQSEEKRKQGRDISSSKGRSTVNAKDGGASEGSSAGQTGAIGRQGGYSFIDQLQRLRSGL